MLSVNKIIENVLTNSSSLAALGQEYSRGQEGEFFDLESSEARDSRMLEERKRAEFQAKIEQNRLAMKKEVEKVKKLLNSVERDEFGEEITKDDKAKEDFVKLLEVAAQTKAPDSLKPDGKISFLKDFIKNMESQEAIRVLKEVGKSKRGETEDSAIKDLFKSIENDIVAKLEEDSKNDKAKLDSGFNLDELSSFNMNESAKIEDDAEFLQDADGFKVILEQIQEGIEANKTGGKSQHRDRNQIAKLA